MGAGLGLSSTPEELPEAPGDAKRSRTDTVKRARTATESQVTLLKNIEVACCDENDRLVLGHLLEWMDAASCLSAEKHCGRSAVTLVMDDLDFAAGSDNLLRRGHTCVLDGKVTRAFGSSMEVCVNVAVADMVSGTMQSVCHGYFMYVTMKTEEEKASKAKVEVPGLLPQSVEEHLEFGLANKRKSFRMQRESRVQEIVDATPQVTAEDASKFDARSKGVLFTELVLPFHANHMGNTFGGQIMAWMVKGASAAIWLYIRRSSSRIDSSGKLGVDKFRHMWLRPVAIDQIHFKSPSHVGDRVQVFAQVTRVFTSNLEVLVRVTSASVGAQDKPIEVNVGYLTYAVHDDAGPLCNIIPDVTTQTVEQEVEHRRAVARQQYRLQRRETTSKPDALASAGISVEFSPDTSQADELAVHCISDILRVKDGTELRWETLPDSGDGVCAFVDFGPSTTGAVTRLKLSCTIACPPRMCYEMLQDVARRKEWDPTCVDCSSSRQPIGEDAELVRIVFAAPKVKAALREASTASTDATAPQHELHEMLLLRAWREDKDSNSFVVVARSVRCDSARLSEGMKRGEILPTGYIIAESPGSNGTAAQVTFIGQFSQASFEFVRPYAVKITKSFRDLMEKNALKAEKDNQGYTASGAGLETF